MPICAVVDIQTNELVNRIVADETDLAPERCKLVEIPQGYYWDEETRQVVVIPQNTEVETSGA
jgi:hypothetical protein